MNIKSNQILLLMLLSALAFGCRREESITRYEIPKDRSGLDHLREDTSPAAGTAAAQPNANREDDRMVVALALRDDATWFFKLNGPVSRVNETEDRWRPFLESITFDDKGKPKWKLPEGWKAAGQKPMRFATLVVDEKQPPIEIAVSSLSAGQDLLMNVNRWRGQLGLEPAKNEDLKDLLTTIEAGDEKLNLFDATGKMSGGMMPPFARPAARPGVVESNPEARAVDFTAPDGWERGKSSPFLKARLTKSDGDLSAQISVSSLPAAANKWMPNAKRWAGQVGMQSSDETQLTDLTETVTVDGQEGKLVRLVPKEGKATIAAMIKKGSDAWFFKLTGDRQMVSDNDDVFIEFLKTVKLP